MLISGKRLRQIITSEVSKRETITEVKKPKWGRKYQDKAVEIQKVLLAKAGINPDDKPAVKLAIGCARGKCPDGYFGDKTTELWNLLGGGEIPDKMDAALTAANALTAKPSLAKTAFKAKMKAKAKKKKSDIKPVSEGETVDVVGVTMVRGKTVWYIKSKKIKDTNDNEYKMTWNFGPSGGFPIYMTTSGKWKPWHPKGKVVNTPDDLKAWPFSVSNGFGSYFATFAGLTGEKLDALWHKQQAISDETDTTATEQELEDLEALGLDKDAEYTTDFAAQAMQDEPEDLMSQLTNESVIDPYVPLTTGFTLKMTRSQLLEVTRRAKAQRLDERVGWWMGKEKFYRILNQWLGDKSKLTPKEANWLGQVYTDYNAEARKRLDKKTAEKFTSWESELMQAFVDANYGKDSDPIWQATVPKLKRITPVLSTAKVGLKGTQATSLLPEPSGNWKRSSDHVKILQGALSEKGQMDTPTERNRLGCRRASRCPDGVWGPRTQGTWDELVGVSLPDSWTEAMKLVQRARTKKLASIPYPVRQPRAPKSDSDATPALTPPEMPPDTIGASTEDLAKYPWVTHSSGRTWFSPDDINWKSHLDYSSWAAITAAAGSPTFSDAFVEWSAIRMQNNDLVIAGVLNSTGKKYLDTLGITYDPSGWITYAQLDEAITAHPDVTGLKDWVESDYANYKIDTPYDDINSEWEQLPDETPANT